MTSEEDIDFQSGEHNIDRTPSLSESEDGFIEFDFEARAVFKRLADDIYKSTEAGIREPLSNALTAIRQAEREHALNNGVVEITLEESDGLSLTLRDNGIGISEAVLTKVLAVIGRSMNRDDGSVSGKYGMGFLACYKLVGTDGGFVMHTRSRKTDEAISGIWKPGGFDQDVHNELPDAFEEDEYGTEFEFFLKDGITASDVRTWVENHSRWARYPVVYREFDEDGREVYNEDYGGHSFIDEYEEDDMYLKIENEFFEAVCSPQARGRTLLLDSPIERNFSGYTDNPWRMDVRLKNENGVVIEGPNTGMMPVGNAEYKDMAEERRERYIPERKLHEDDLCLPEPTGTRDTLGEQDAFWWWLGEQFDAKYNEWLGEVFRSVSSLSDFNQLSQKEKDLLDSGFNKKNLSVADTSNFRNSLQSTLDIDVDQNVAELFVALRKSVKHLKRGGDVSTLNKSRNSDYESRLIWEIMETIGGEGDVYMGVSLNQQKANVVWASSEKNHVVAVEGTEMYPEFEEALGWKKLKNVTKDTIDQYNVSDDLQEQFKAATGRQTDTNAGKKAPNRRLTIHSNKSRRSGTVKMKVEDIEASLKGEEPEDSEEFPFHRLILFPSNSDHNLSDNYWAACRQVGIANCSVSVYDYLKEYEAVCTIDEYIENATEHVFTTSDGEQTLISAQETGTVVLHQVPAMYKEDFTSDMVMDRMKNYIAFEADDFEFVDSPSEVVYVPVASADLQEIRPLLEAKTSGVSSKLRVVGSNRYDAGVYIEIDNVEAYAYCVLNDWVESPEVEKIVDEYYSLQNGGYDAITLLNSLKQDGDTLVSEDLDGMYDSEDVTYPTSRGELTYSEMKSKGVPVFHILPRETVELFDENEEIMKNCEEFIEDRLKNLSSRRKRIDDLERVVYVPTTPVGYERINDQTGYQTRYIQGDVKQSVSGNRIRVNSDTALYAYGRLSEWHDTELLNHLCQTKTELMDGGYEMVESLAKAHDAGAMPSTLSE